LIQANNICISEII